MRIDGTDLSDQLYGSVNTDHIFGHLGADYIDAGAGDDRIYGGGDNDYIFAGDGNDVVFAGDGNDVLYSDNGVDHLYGGRGDDALGFDGGSGYAYGGDGNDGFTMADGVAFGGTGNDTFLVSDYHNPVTPPELQWGIVVGGKDADTSVFQLEAGWHDPWGASIEDFNQAEGDRLVFDVRMPDPANPDGPEIQFDDATVKGWLDNNHDGQLSDADAANQQVAGVYAQFDPNSDALLLHLWSDTVALHHLDHIVL